MFLPALSQRLGTVFRRGPLLPNRLAWSFQSHFSDTVEKEEVQDAQVALPQTLEECQKELDSLIGAGEKDFKDANVKFDALMPIMDKFGWTVKTLPGADLGQIATRSDLDMYIWNKIQKDFTPKPAVILPPNLTIQTESDEPRLPRKRYWAIKRLKKAASQGRKERRDANAAARAKRLEEEENRPRIFEHTISRR